MCTADWNGPVTVKSVYHVKSYDQAQLMAAIAQGPTSVTIDASETVFHAYTGGIISGTACGTSLDHAVTAVGYGTQGTGKDFYIVKNSWGTSWGDKGFIMMARNTNNMCGIATMSSYPMV